MRHLTLPHPRVAAPLARPAAQRRPRRPRAASDGDASTELVDAPYTLLSDDPAELAAAIARLRSANARTRAELRTALEALDAALPPAAAATMASLEMVGTSADSVETELAWALGGTPPSVAVDPLATALSSADSSDDESDAAASRARLPTPPPVPPSAPSTTLSIVFVTSELPYCKTGGLGDVSGALPRALAARGHDVLVVSPFYVTGGAADGALAGAVDTGKRARVEMGACGPQEVGFFTETVDGVTWAYVDHGSYRRPGTPYCAPDGAPFGDNAFRFALLSRAAVHAPGVLAFGAGRPLVFVANDWHAALVPVLLASHYKHVDPALSTSKSLLIIHNVAHQGVEPESAAAHLGLPDGARGAVAWHYPEWAAVNGPAINCLKGGAETADAIVAVSAGFAYEATTPEGGWGLDGVLRGRGEALTGIVNGIDVREWDPAADPHTAAPFTASDFAGKAVCKAALQKELGLPVDAGTPLCVFVGRLDYQKSPDVLLAALPGILSLGTQLVMLGSGDKQIENEMAAAEAAHPHSFRGWRGFSVPVSHRLFAAADIVIVPSRFEPCGLVQLSGFRYGALCVAHETGGLRDTVVDAARLPWPPQAAAQPYTPADVGTGWLFSPPEAAPLVAAVGRAVDVYRHQPDRWLAMRSAAAGQDVSWDRAAAQYEAAMVGLVER